LFSFASCQKLQPAEYSTIFEGLGELLDKRVQALILTRSEMPVGDDTDGEIVEALQEVGYF